MKLSPTCGSDEQNCQNSLREWENEILVLLSSRYQDSLVLGQELSHYSLSTLFSHYKSFSTLTWPGLTGEDTGLHLGLQLFSLLEKCKI